MPTGGNSFAIPAPIKIAANPIKQDNSGLANLIAVQKAVAEQQLMAARAAAAAARASGAGGAGAKYTNYIDLPLGDGNFQTVPVVGADKENRAERGKAMMSQRLAELAAQDKDLQESLSKMGGLSVKGQQLELDKIRQQHLPRLAKKWGISPEQAADFMKQSTAGIQQNIAAQQKAIDQTGFWQSFVDSAKIGGTALWDAIRSLGSTPEEKFAMGEAQSRQRQEILASNPHLREEALREQEGINSWSDFFDNKMLNIAEALGDTLSGAGGIIGTQAGMQTLVTGVGKGLTLLPHPAAKAAGVALQTPAARTGVALLTGGTTGAGLGGMNLANRLVAEVEAGRMTREDAIDALEKGQLPAQLLGGGVGAAFSAMPAVNLLPKGIPGLTRSAATKRGQDYIRQQAIKASLAEGASNNIAKAAGERAVHEAVTRYNAPGMLPGSATIGRYLQAIPRTAVDLATFNAADTAAGNIAYAQATGQPVSMEGVGQAAWSGVEAAPFFAMLGAGRAHYTPRNIPQEPTLLAVATSPETGIQQITGTLSTSTRPRPTLPDATVLPNTMRFSAGGATSGALSMPRTAVVPPEFYNSVPAPSQRPVPETRVPATPTQPAVDWQTIKETATRVNTIRGNSKQWGPTEVDKFTRALMTGQLFPDDLSAYIETLPEKSSERKALAAALAQDRAMTAAMFAEEKKVAEAPKLIDIIKTTDSLPEALEAAYTLLERKDVTPNQFDALRKAAKTKDIRRGLLQAKAIYDFYENNKSAVNASKQGTVNGPEANQNSASSRSGATPPVAGDGQLGEGGADTANPPRNSGATPDSQALAADIADEISQRAAVSNPADESGRDARLPAQNTREAEAPAGTPRSETGETGGADRESGGRPAAAESSAADTGERSTAPERGAGEGSDGATKQTRANESDAVARLEAEAEEVEAADTALEAVGIPKDKETATAADAAADPRAALKQAASETKAEESFKAGLDTLYTKLQKPRAKITKTDIASIKSSALAALQKGADFSRLESQVQVAIPPEKRRPVMTALYEAKGKHIIEEAKTKPPVMTDYASDLRDQIELLPNLTERGLTTEAEEMGLPPIFERTIGEAEAADEAYQVMWDKAAGKTLTDRQQVIYERLKANDIPDLNPEAVVEAQVEANAAKQMGLTDVEPKELAGTSRQQARKKVEHNNGQSKFGCRSS